MPTEYHYSSAPQPIKPAKKYRNEVEGVTLNLLADPRVIKGSTHALARQLAMAKKSISSTDAKREATTSSLKNSMTTSNRSDVIPNTQPTYQFEVSPFVSPDMDMYAYLTEQEPPTRVEREIASQTDVFNVRPQTPDYIPRKTGIDSSTQVEDVTELFDFNKEVDPLLQVIVDKTLQQALFEVRSEIELLRLHEDVQYYADVKSKEEAEVQQKLQVVKIDQKNKQEELKRKQKEISNQDRVRVLVAGLQASRQIVPQIFENIATELFTNGSWKHGDKECVSKEVLKPLVKEVQKRLDLYESARSVLDELLLAAQQKYDSNSQCAHTAAGTGTGRGTRSLVVTVTVRAANIIPVGETDPEKAIEDVKIGPLTVSREETLIELQARIMRELKALSVSATVELKKYFVGLLRGLDIADDGPLLNHSLPPSVSFVV